jgi:hypothetical protein
MSVTKIECVVAASTYSSFDRSICQFPDHSISQCPIQLSFLLGIAMVLLNNSQQVFIPWVITAIEDSVVEIQ